MIPVDQYAGTILAGVTAIQVYVVQTNVRTWFERCILMTTDPGDLVWTQPAARAQPPTVAEQWGRRWITIDTSRVALALARARIMGARYPYYLLADTLEGQIKEAKLLAQLQPRNRHTATSAMASSMTARRTSR